MPVRFLAGAEEGAGVVDEHVDSRFCRGDLGRNPFHLRKAGEISLVGAVCDVGSAVVQPRQGRLAALVVARHQHQSRSHAAQPFRRDDLRDPGGGADDDDFPCMAPLPASRFKRPA